MPARAFLIGLTAAVFSTAASGQVARYELFGAGCPSVLVPFSVEGTPGLGSTLNVLAQPPVVNQNFRRAGVIIVGNSDTQWGPVSLPFATGVLSQPGITFCGDLLVSVDATVPVPVNATGAQNTSVPFRIPRHPRFIGTEFYQQVVELFIKRGGGTFVNFSVGGRGRIGI